MWDYLMKTPWGILNFLKIAKGKKASQNDVSSKLL